ncbi:uncharacterized protein LOC108737287 isoform X2 [Agrilus planipennis]|uniref:Uncharacterized protein LOC108737287 isoform X2 n=1 Tax=Agrilus planipennis TaxID=224129 RepID=A0A1W4WNQ1_AGRPL|nr:uncharacterized protein LOC108737287 isoform X2 [Agrilus planipennis]
MMATTPSILFFLACLFPILYASGHFPQVHEEVNEIPVSDSNRIPKSRYVPPWSNFNYSTILQRDQQKWRYFQQQQVDLLNLLKKKPLVRIVSSLRNTKFGDTSKKEKPKISLRNQKGNAVQELKRFSRTANFDKENQGDMQTIDKGATNRDVSRSDYVLSKNFIGHKTQSSTSSKNGAEKDEQRDNQMKALNSLLGKSPIEQLEGLKHLLKSQTKVLSVTMPSRTRKRYVPVAESTLDVPVPQIKPVVVVAYSPNNDRHNGPYTPLASTQEQLQQLQLQLDSFSKAQADEQIRKAQEDAYQRVQTQHAALALAQQEALEKMKEINSHVMSAPDDAGHPIAPPPTLPSPPLPAANVQTSSSNSLEEVPAINPIHQSKPLDSLLVPVAHPLQINAASLSTPSPVIEESSGNEERRPNEIKDYEDQNDYATNYAFGYQVQDYDSENNFGHEETNNGNSAKGHYHVQLPDGRIQHVEYTADATGFHAKVTYTSKS